MVKDIAIGAKGPGFDSLDSQDKHSVAKGVLTAATFLQSCVAYRHKAAEMGTATRSTLRSNIADIMKDLISYVKL